MKQSRVVAKTLYPRPSSTFPMIGKIDLSHIKEEIPDDPVRPNAFDGTELNFQAIDDKDAVLSHTDVPAQPSISRKILRGNNQVNRTFFCDYRPHISTGNDFRLPSSIVIKSERSIVIKSEPDVDIKEELPEASANLKSGIRNKDDLLSLNLHGLRQCNVLLERLPLFHPDKQDALMVRRTVLDTASSKRSLNRIATCEGNTALRCLKSKNATPMHEKNINSLFPVGKNKKRIGLSSHSTTRQSDQPSYEFVGKRIIRKIHQRYKSGDEIPPNAGNEQDGSIDLLQCDTCKRNFSLKKTLRSHVLTHLKSKNEDNQNGFSCDVCKKVIKRKHDFKQHLKIHSTVCKKELHTKTVLKYHELIHSGVRRFECHVCKKRFFAKVHLKVHLRRVHEKKSFSCNQCDVIFSCRRELSSHLLTHPSKSPPKPNTHDENHPIKCHICEKTFQWKASLRSHILRHTNEIRFKCEKCPKSYSQKGDWKRHQLTHSGVRPFSCSSCDKRFVRRYDLNRHIVTHEELKIRHQCHICKKAFSRKDHLSGHLRTHSTMAHSTKAPSRLFHCDICSRQYILKSSLRVHMLRHLGPKHLTCKFCGKVFGYLDNLTSHLRSHRTKDLQCGKCLNWFREKRDLRHHMMIHLEIRPFKCDMCAARFPRKTNLRNHLRRHR